MHDYLNRNWDYMLSLGNAGVTLATIAAWPWDKIASLLFVTVPVGVWSWFRLIDYLKERYARHHAPTTNRTESL